MPSIIFHLFILCSFVMMIAALDFSNCTGIMKVCFENDVEFDTNGKRLCYANKMKKKQIRIASFNWDSGLHTNFIAQIIISELLQIPTTTQETLGGLMDYYPTVNGWEKKGPDVIMNGAESQFPALQAASTDPFCQNITESIGCAHISFETWPIASENLPSFPNIIDAGAIGSIGQIGWYIPTYVANTDPSLLSYRGLTNGTKVQAIFKRPYTLAETCAFQGLNADTIIFCAYFNTVTQCIGSNKNSFCEVYLLYTSDFINFLSSKSIPTPAFLINTTYAFLSPFLPNHQSPSKSPAGFYISPSPACSWTSFDFWQAAQGASGMSPVYLADSDMLNVWEAAVQQNEAVMFYAWTPDSPLLRQDTQGDIYSISRLSLVPWTQSCENLRPNVAEQCIAAANPVYNYTKMKNGCDYPANILWKAVPDSLFLHYPEVYTLVTAFNMNNDVDNIIAANIEYPTDLSLSLKYPRKGDLRKAVTCQWVSDHLAEIKGWIPPSFLGLRCLNGCSNNGVCFASSDGNPIGDCKCKSNFAGLDCSLAVPTSLVAQGTSTFFICLACIGIFQCTVYLLWVIIKRDTKLIKSSTPSFMVLICIGGLIGNAGIIVLAHEGLLITEGSICGFGEFLLSVCYSFLLSGLAVKTNRVIIVFKTKFKFVTHKLSSMFFTVFLISLVDVIVFTIWWILFKPTLIMATNGISNPIVCGNWTPWLVFIVIVPKVLMLLKCVEQAFEIRRHVTIKAFNESTPLLLVVGNFCVCAAFFGPLLVFISDPSTVLMIELVGAFFTINCTVLFIMGYKLVHVLRFGYSLGNTGDTMKGGETIRPQASHGISSDNRGGSTDVNSRGKSGGSPSDNHSGEDITINHLKTKYTDLVEKHIEALKENAEIKKVLLKIADSATVAAKKAAVDNEIPKHHKKKTEDKIDLKSTIKEKEERMAGEASDGVNNLIIPSKKATNKITPE